MTPKAPPVSHYIAKFHLKNWCHPRGIVTCFNFATGEFKTERAARMYVSPAPFPEAIEDWLDRMIEQPIGEYMARVKRGPDDSLPNDDARRAALEPRPREWKAIVLALLCQAGRTALARDPSDTLLADMVAKDPREIEQLLAVSDITSRRFVAMTKGETLCVPEVGLVTLPMVGGFGFLLPVHPRVFLAVAPRAVLDDEIERTLSTEGVATSFSVGLIGDLVVVPPLRPDADLVAMADVLRQHRASATRLAQLFLRMNDMIGVTLANTFAPPRQGS